MLQHVSSWFPPCNTHVLHSKLPVFFTSHREMSETVILLAWPVTCHPSLGLPTPKLLPLSVLCRGESLLGGGTFFATEPKQQFTGKWLKMVVLKNSTLSLLSKKISVIQEKQVD